MTLIVCLDDACGMTFNKRRQSRDAVVTADIITSASGKLVISPFSAKLFAGADVRILENPLGECESDDCCFIEMGSARGYLDRIDEIIIYKWNRLYPSDTKFDLEPAKCGFSLAATSEFVGSSHDKITKEIYKK